VGEGRRGCRERGAHRGFKGWEGGLWDRTGKMARQRGGKRITGANEQQQIRSGGYAIKERNGIGGFLFHWSVWTGRIMKTLLFSQ